MQKDFDRWNNFKKYIDKDKNFLDFHARDIWWCSIGVNVGTEQHSQTKDFSRPVLIVRRFTPETFWGIPLTTKLKNGDFRVRFVLNGLENDALIFQMRTYDRGRLVRKVCRLRDDEFKKITNMIVNTVSPENEIPLMGEISEPEGKVYLEFSKTDFFVNNDLVKSSTNAILWAI